MKIAAVEVLVPNHYLAVISLIKICKTKQNVSLKLFISEEVNQLIIGANLDLKNVEIHIHKPEKSISDLFKQIEEFSANKTFFISVYYILKHINRTKLPGIKYVGIHSSEELLDLNLFRDLKAFDFKFNRDLLYKLRTIVPRESKEYLQKIIFKRKTLTRSNTKLLAFGKNVQNELKQYINEDKVTVLPFCVKDNNLTSTSKDIAPDHINVVIPGTVDERRRDYLTFFEILQKNQNNFDPSKKITFHLLGHYGQKNKPLDKLISNFEAVSYINIKFHKDYVSEAYYSESMKNASIIFGNLNKKSQYGKLKETGVFFNMIRYSLPGILPESLKTEEFKHSCAYFSSYEQVIKLLLSWQKNTDELNILREQAKIDAAQYAPENFDSILEY